jgi:hypothetical protein
MFQLLIVSQRRSAQLSYIGGAGVEGGQGSSDYNFGAMPPAACMKLAACSKSDS